MAVPNWMVFRKSSRGGAIFNMDLKNKNVDTAHALLLIKFTRMSSRIVALVALGRFLPNVIVLVSFQIKGLNA